MWTEPVLLPEGLSSVVHPGSAGSEPPPVSCSVSLQASFWAVNEQLILTNLTWKKCIIIHVYK